MTPQQLHILREALAGGKITDDLMSSDRPFLRGWNQGVEFAENQINKILKDAKNDPS